MNACKGKESLISFIAGCTEHGDETGIEELLLPWDSPLPLMLKPSSQVKPFLEFLYLSKLPLSLSM